VSVTADSVAHLLVHTVTVHRRQVAGDGMGGQSVEWVTVGTVQARVSLPTVGSIAEIVAAAQANSRAPFFVYLAPDADVRRGDLLDDGERLLWVEAVTWPSIRAYQRAEAREYQTDQEPV